MRGVLVALLLGAGLAVFMYCTDRKATSYESTSSGVSASGSLSTATSPTARPHLQQSKRSTSPEGAMHEGATNQGAIRAAEEALQHARSERETAEALLDRIERDISSMETYVADMEARGEDPADNSEEALARLNPILADYLDAQVRFNRAEKAEQRAADELRAARSGTHPSPTGER